MKNNTIQQLPVGVKDILPQEALNKRKIENAFAEIFGSWGYQEVVTPVFENYATLSVGRIGFQNDKIFKFIDRQGQIIALRPDMTTPIARLVSSRMRDEVLPLRLFYLANVFSFEDTQAGRQREFYQAGIELIGDASPFADAEAIAIAAESLKACGLQNFKISIGHVDVLHGMTEEYGFDEAQTDRMKAVITEKNYVGLQEVLEEFQVSKEEIEKFMQLVTLRGKSEVLDKAKGLVGNEKTIKALNDLQKVFAALEAYDILDYVEIDLGVLRDLDYYTGVVFEGYSAYLGYPILGGGRYDKLMDQFEYDVPATGFALGLERVLLSLQKEGLTKEERPIPDYLITFVPAKAAEALSKARKLRENGAVVITLQASGANESGLMPSAKETIYFK